MSTQMATMRIGVGLPGGGGRVKTVMPRGTMVPSRKDYRLATTKDHQRTFDLWIFEGEGETTGDCHLLGALQLTGLPAGPRGSVRIVVDFDLGEDCLLTVRARTEDGRREAAMVFPTQATPPEVRRRLASEAQRSAAGLPPVTAPGATGASPAPSRADDDGDDDRPAGLKGLWNRFTGR